MIPILILYRSNICPTFEEAMHRGSCVHVLLFRIFRQAFYSILVKTDYTYGRNMVIERLKLLCLISVLVSSVHIESFQT